MTDQTQAQRVESVLKKIRELKENDEKAAKATGKNFNVFSVLGVERKEVRHSAFLKDLLDPKGTHSQGTVFLEHFLKLPPLLKELPDSFRENLEEFQVGSEASTIRGDGFIDILLEKEDACIIIENKIDATLGIGQLNKYYKDAKERDFEDEQINLIYLTPNGKKPIEESEPLDSDCVICISYESHIVEWLEKCIKEVEKIDRIRDLLSQYQMLVKKLTGELVNEELTVNIVKVLTKNPDLIFLLERSIPETKRQIQWKLWEKLYEEILECCSVEKCSEEPKERIKGCPEVEFKVSSFKADKFDIGLRIQLEKQENGYRVCYGFCLIEKNESVDKCKESHFNRHVELIKDALCMKNRNDFWLGWKSLKSVSLADFVKDDRLEKLVKSITDASKIAVDVFKEKAQEKGLL